MRRPHSHQQLSQQPRKTLPMPSAMAALVVTIMCMIPQSSVVVKADLPANPLPYDIIQPDGSHTGTVFLKGRLDENIWEEDDKQRTIILDEDDGFEYYAVLDDVTGELVSDRSCKVGACDAEKAGFVKRQKPSHAVQEQTVGPFGRKPRRSRLHPKVLRYKARKRQKKMAQRGKEGYNPNRTRSLRAGGGGTANRGLQEEGAVLKNMVILMRFSDHVGRLLPTLEQYDELFNSIDSFGANANSNCPTGSVRDCFRIGSHGDLDLESEVFGWLTLPREENYYVDGYYGITGLFQREAMKWALDEVEKQLNNQGRQFSEFDEDGDSFIDSITFIHSGYDAANGGTDCYQASSTNRIWSHKWQIPGEVSQARMSVQLVVSRLL